ncbi:hypothetical protein [Streptomyces sp. NPDC060194]|uniref:hypothetical protein n=1 Tax=Streptomyces sp. NPDC060194 TaxID=3347069 RepID=UPI003646FA77
MTKPPTAAQRRIVLAADPVTGLLTGSEAPLAGLVRGRLAFRHPRPPHHHYLTPAGHRLREDLLRPPEDAPAPEPEPAPDRTVFAARTGTEPAALLASDEPAARAREVHSAWQGLLEIRRLTNRDGAVDRPCAWERGRLVPSAALALEAAGCRPGPDGYRVLPTDQPEAVAVHAPRPGPLAACAAALTAAGWQASEHGEPRTRVRYLLASPRRG